MKDSPRTTLIGIILIVLMIGIGVVFQLGFIGEKFAMISAMGVITIMGSLGFSMSQDSLSFTKEKPPTKEE